MGSSAAAPLIEVPQDFRDPITFELMVDPVLLVETGHTYNRQSITDWFRRGHRTCPKTNRSLKSLLLSTNWTLRSLINSWADQHGVTLPSVTASPAATSSNRVLAIKGPEDAPAGDNGDLGMSEAAGAGHGAELTVHEEGMGRGALEGYPAMQNSEYVGSLQSHPISFDGEHAVEAQIRETWTFFEGLDSPGGDILRLHFDQSSTDGMHQLFQAADKVPNCIAFNSAGYLKQALLPRRSWIVSEDPSWEADTDRSNSQATSSSAGPPGLYVRTQCLPFIDSGCNSWAADAALAVPADQDGWTFFPGMDSPGGDICQAITAEHAEHGVFAGAGGSSSSAMTPHASADGRVGPVITISSSLALLAVAKPFCVAFNSNGWLKALLQPMHGWVKWTTEAGKGLFVRNDVLMGLLGGVLAHVQGAQSAPVQLAGWTFFQGMDSLGGDVHWSWQNQNDAVKLAQESSMIEGVIAFTTGGYLKTALRPRNEWVNVDVWADKPTCGIYVNNAVLWKLLLG